MLREPVTSSNVRAVGYDDAALALEVEFHNGGVYRYEPVQREEYQELLDAESIGRELRRFKDASIYRCTRLFPCCGEAFDSTVTRHECSTAEVA
jgi:hypothetical protein